MCPSTTTFVVKWSYCLQHVAEFFHLPLHNGRHYLFLTHPVSIEPIDLCQGIFTVFFSLNFGGFDEHCNG